MRSFFVLSTLVFNLLFGNILQAQDFSNKGRDFWVGYGYHQQMTNGAGGGTQDMVLYFATEAITTVTVTIPGTGYSQTYSNIPANTVFTSNPIPKTGSQDARLTGESTSPENKGIHITSDRPIVAYAHIYNQSVSGACILFPTNILGKDYYSINYKNISNSPNSNCWFYVVACDTGMTTVEITPSANTLNHAAGVPFTVNLKQGEIYNVMGQITSATNPYSSVDLTGSKIQSISTGTGSCKKIGVFSGSGRISITCTGSSSSSDNYMVQSFPKSAWGKKYLTTPTGGVMNYNIYRVCVLDPTTVVKLNGSPIGLPLQNNFFYEIPITKNPQLIEADKPILVAQYVTSQGACGNGSQPGDPEVIYLSPVEQNINRVLWNATPNDMIIQHFYNVIIPKSGTAISSFKLDGVTVPASNFITHPQDPGYAYLSQAVGQGQHTISSDSGFNAIAYGFGNAESYGYNAGTNIKDLYQFVSVKNEYATVNFPAACRNSPFFLSMTFPYEPTMIQWVFGSTLNAMGIADVTDNNPVYDSTWIMNGKQLYQYKLSTSYSISAAGTYPIRMMAQNPTSDGCAGLQEINYDLQVFEPPVVDFSFTNNGCVTTPVVFTSIANPGGRSPISWNWDFADGSTASITDPSHSYAGPGSYEVKYSLITDIGCISDTAKHMVVLNNLPIAKFQISGPACSGSAASFTDLSSISGAGTLAKWYWDFGDGSSIVTATTNAGQSHIYSRTGVFNVTLLVETSSGCQSTLFTLPVDVNVGPEAGFVNPKVCLSDPSALFIDTSKIQAGSIDSWEWNFGDLNSTPGNANTSNLQNPSHHYTSSGSYTATLIATGNSGCKDTIAQTFFVNGAVPVAGFTVQNAASLCSNRDVAVVDGSTVDAGNLITVEIYWDYDNDPTNKTIDGSPLAGKTYSHTYPEFGSPASVNYTIRYVAYSGMNCVNTLTKSITVMATPKLEFDAVTPVCSDAPAFDVHARVLNGLPGKGIFSGPGIVSLEGTFSPAEAGYGQHTLRYSYNADNSCSNYVERMLEIYPTPGVNAGPDKTVLEGGTATLSPAVNANFPVTYLWTPSRGLNDPSVAFAVVSPLEDMTYTLTVTSDKGCKSSDQVSVKLLKSPIIPNIFSPNGDGVHDRWEINFLESYPGCTVEIYNRYGQLIFRSVGYSKPWDGMIGGKQAPLGTYYYIVDPKNGRSKMSGYVDIIR